MNLVNKLDKSGVAKLCYFVHVVLRGKASVKNSEASNELGPVVSVRHSALVSVPLAWAVSVLNAVLLPFGFARRSLRSMSERRPDWASNNTDSYQLA